MVLASLASAACATADSLSDLGLYRFLTGMTAGAVIPLSYAFIGDQVPYADRQSVLGRFIAGSLLGATCGPLLGGVFSDSLGWRASFIVPACAFAVISIALMPLVGSETPANAATRSSPLTDYLSLLRSAPARIICLVVAIEGMLFYGAFGFLGAFLRAEFALSYTTIGMLMAGFGLGSVFYCLIVGLLLRHLGSQRMVLAGGGLMFTAFAALATLPHWQLALPAIMVLGFAFYLLHNTLQTLATEMSPSARGSAISAFAFCLFFGQAIGVTGVGWLTQWLGYRPVFTIAGIALAILAMWFAKRLPSLS
jgi:YNFM family putative membrane transporter